MLGLTSSIVLRSGRLSDVIAQLQELLKGVEEVEISPFKYDSELLAAQVCQILCFSSCDRSLKKTNSMNVLAKT